MAVPGSASPPRPLAVIVRTLGRAHLADALDSLAAQTRQDFETIIVDMSGGPAKRIIESRRARLPGLQHLELAGPIDRGEALNLGVTRSTAAAIAILDDDNVYTPGHVDALVNGLAETGADLVYAGVLRRTLTPEGRVVREEPAQTSFSRDRLLFGNFIYTTGTAFRREIWQRVGGYDPRFRVYEDWEFLIRVAHGGRIAALPTISGVSQSFTGDPARPSHHEEGDECSRCAAGLFWTHRDKYTKRLFDANPDLVRTHPHVPFGGTRSEYEPLVASWLGTATGPWSPPGARVVAVLGHPGHELAIYGVLQRHPPVAVIVVTDGGGVQRVRESQEGLQRIGLLQRTVYLNFPEARFYDALLDHDLAFVRSVAASVRAALVPLAPTHVLCDAVEFYNPVHDITLPIVRLALQGSGASVYEIPLVYEIAGRDGEYAVQRVPDAMGDRRVTFLLDEGEVDAKAAARDEVYWSLHDQAGPELLRVPRREMAREELAVAAGRVAAPGAGGRALRYERRARLLHAEGRVERMIAYAGHFAPLLDGLGVPRDAP